MRIFYTLWSGLFLAFFPLVAQNQDFFGEPVVTVFDLQKSRSFAYNREVDGDLLTFSTVNGTFLVDGETGSLWDISNGQSIAGPKTSKRLAPAAISPERIFPYYDVPAHPRAWLAIWQRFDVNWYLAIARNGYGKVPGDVHFPPLYPVLINLFSVVFRDDLISALLISQFSLYILVKLLFDLFSGWGRPELAARSLFFLLIFPTSFFFFSAYTEATFVVFAVLSLKAIRDGKWPWAGFWIFCAVLMRLQGVVLLVPLVWAFWRTRLKTTKLSDLLLSVFPPLVAVTVYLTLRANGGDPSVVPITETNLHARIVPPWENLLYSFRYLASGVGHYIDMLNLGVFILFGILIIVCWKRIPIEYGLFSIASIVLLSMRLVDTQPLNSMIRYVLTIFPAFYLFGFVAGHKWMNLFLFTCFLSLNLFLSAQFFLWGWIA